MNTLLYILTGLLVIFSALFLWITARISAAQEQQVLANEAQFAYTKDSLSELSGGVESLHGKLDTAVIPRLDAFYSHVVKAHPQSESLDLLSLLKRLGYESVTPATDDNTVFFVGILHQELKISLFVAFDRKALTLAFRSFAFSIPPELPSSVLLALLALNAETVASSIGVARLRGKNVLTADYFLPIPGGTVDSQVVANLINSLANRQVQMGAVLKRYGITKTPIIGTEYMEALPIDPATGQRFFSIGIPPEITPSSRAQTV
jgi:hypothetical protein